MFYIPKYHLAQLAAEAYHVFIAKLDMILKQFNALEITWQMKLGRDIELHRLYPGQQYKCTHTCIIIPHLAKHKPCLHNPSYDCWEYICSDIPGLKFPCYPASQIKPSEFAVYAAAQAPQQSECKTDF